MSESSCHCAVHIKQFSRLDWRKVHYPSVSVNLVRALDRHIKGYVMQLGLERPDLADLQSMEWRYYFWPRELSITIAADPCHYDAKQLNSIVHQLRLTRLPDIVDSFIDLQLHGVKPAGDVVTAYPNILAAS